MPHIPQAFQRLVPRLLRLHFRGRSWHRLGRQVRDLAMGVWQNGDFSWDDQPWWGYFLWGYLYGIYIYTVYITNQLDMIWAVTEMGYTHQIAIFKGKMMANHCNSRYLILWGLPVTISSANIEPAMRGGLEISNPIKTGCSQALS